MLVNVPIDHCKVSFNFIQENISRIKAIIGFFRINNSNFREENVGTSITYHSLNII